MLPQYGFRVVYYNIIRGFNNINVGENGGGGDYNKDATVGKAIVGQAVVGYEYSTYGTSLIGEAKVDEAIVGYVPSSINVAVVGTSEAV